MKGRRLRRWFRLRGESAHEASRDVDEEIRLHVELRAEQLRAQGMEAAAAEREAGRLFAVDAGTVRALHVTARERNRRMRMRERWESWWSDARYAARSLSREPVLAGFVVVILGLGAGANVTAFSLVDRMLLRTPAHVRDADGLVKLYGRVETAAGVETSMWLPWATYRHLRDGMRSFAVVGAYRVRPTSAGSAGEARTLRIATTVGGFFTAAGARPLRGRFFSDDEDAAVVGNLAILSESVWRTSYAGDPGVLGATLQVDEQRYTIVGIAPAGFNGPETRRVDAWLLYDSRTAGTVNWWILGRLRPGATAAQASEEAASVHARTADDGPAWMKEATVAAGPIRFDETGREPQEATLARWLAGVSLIILWITLANVVSLLLVRLARRRRELAIRVALGSGRGRVVRLLAMEGGLLALAGAVASVIVARITEPLIRRSLFAGEAAWTLTVLDVRVLALVSVIAVLTAAILGLSPALRAGKPELTAMLRTGKQGGESHSRTRSVLTVAQAALSVVLLVGAGLFLRSMARVNAIDLGIDAAGLVAVQATLPRTPLRTSEDFRNVAKRELELYDRLADAARRVPGVERAAVAIGVPLDGGSFSAAVWVPGIDSVPVLPDGGPYASKVGTDYFATAGTALLAGRPFTDQDRASAEPVILVGETMAARLWPGRSALGECVRVGFPNAPCARIVGIARDVHRTGLHQAPSFQYYLPLSHEGLFSGATLLVRARRASRPPLASLRQAMLDAEPAIQSVSVGLLRETLSGETRPLRLGIVTFGLSSALALVVAALGLYSLMAYMVAWRTREIGVRLALGATDGQLTRMVVGSGAVLAGAGVLAGLVLVLAGGRWLEPHLFETSAVDPVVLGGVAVLLLGVALLAGWAPARRAMRISPTESLRAE